MKNIKRYFILLFVFVMFIEFGYSNQVKKIEKSKVKFLRRKTIEPGKSDENYKKYKIIDLKPDKIYLLPLPEKYDSNDIWPSVVSWFPKDNDKVLIIYQGFVPPDIRDRKIIYIYNFNSNQFEFIDEDINKESTFALQPRALNNKKIILFEKNLFELDKREIISYDIVSKERKQIGTFEGENFPFPKDGKIEKFRDTYLAGRDSDNNNIFNCGMIDDKGHRGILRFKKRFERVGGETRSIYEKEVVLDFGGRPIILLPDGKSILFKYEDENSNINFCLYNFEKKGDIKRLDIGRIPERPDLKIEYIISISPDRKKILCKTEFDRYRPFLVLVEFNKELCGR